MARSARESLWESADPEIVIGPFLQRSDHQLALAASAAASSQQTSRVSEEAHERTASEELLGDILSAGRMAFSARVQQDTAVGRSVPGSSDVVGARSAIGEAT